MVLDEVSQGTRTLVVPGAAADATVLGRGDLDAVDKVAVPDRLEQRVGKAQCDQVLNRLLAEVVVDPEHLGLVEHAQHLPIQRAGRLEVVPERLFDHDPRMRVLQAVQSRCLELAGDRGEESRRRRKVENAIELARRLIVELVERARELRVDGVVVERSRYVADVCDQAVEHIGIGLAPRESHDRFARHLAKVLVRVICSRDADEPEAFGQRTVVREVVERRQQLAMGQVAGPAEHHECGRAHR